MRPARMTDGLHRLGKEYGNDMSIESCAPRERTAARMASAASAGRIFAFGRRAMALRVSWAGSC